MDLSEDELRVLDKGLKFAPIRNFNKFQTYISLQKFVRTLNIKCYFLSKPGEPPRTSAQVLPSGTHSNLSNKSVFNPPKNDHKHIEVFKNMVSSDLETMRIKKVRDPHYLKAGIATLEKKKDVVVHPVDKGGGLVIICKAFYNGEMDRLLSDRSTYQVLNKDPVFEYNKELQAIIAQGKSNGILNKKESAYLDPSVCRRPNTYFLPKVHKNAQNPPGRPIVNGIDSVSARLGQ